MNSYAQQLADEDARYREAERQRLAAPAKRPSGAGLLGACVILLLVGLTMITAGLIMPAMWAPTYIERIVNPQAVGTYNGVKWPVFWSGVALVNGGLTFWALGTIVRALFFLPGRNVTRGDL